MAALRASELGAKVLVLEATSLLGGTTAFSGGNLWVPFNRWARQVPELDTRERAEAYVRRCLGPRADDARWPIFFDRINEVIEYLESKTLLRFFPTRYPDSFGEWAEGSCSRHIGTGLLTVPDLGTLNGKVRRPPSLSVYLRFKDFDDMRIPFLMTRSAKARLGLRVLWRRLRRKVGMGYAFVLGLIEANLRRGVAFKLNSRVTRLIVDHGAVVGVEVNGTDRYHARRGVVVASGGFDHNDALMRQYLPATIEDTMTPPVNLGDHIALAQQVGASLQRMNEAWYLPAKVLPGAGPYEGKQLGTWITGDRVWPHMLWVNSRGERFVNESAQNSANAFYQLDPETGERPNLISWTIFDTQFRRRYPVLMSLYPGQPDPDWLVSARTMPELAEKIDVPLNNLQTTVARFNDFAVNGRDDDFARGEGAYDQYFGDHRMPHHTLGTVREPPFYAYRNSRSSVGTKGGIAINACSQALDDSGRVIPGLYAAGNSSAALNGPITVASAATISPTLVAAYVAAENACG
jgi:3-oxosteroid 1-dehydrogenase